MAFSTPLRPFALLLGMTLLVSGCSGHPAEGAEGDEAGTSVEASPDGAPTEAPSDEATTSDSIDAVEALEQEYDARVGVFMIDLEDGSALSHQGDERFGFASTMKTFAVAALLHSTDAEELDDRVQWTAEDIEAAGYSPVTEQAVDTGLTWRELAEAAVRESDNTAMNLILERLGGPEGLQHALEEIGDSVSRPVDLEPELNDVDEDDAANTSSAEALAENLERLVADEWLDEDDRHLLLEWMSDNPTGDTLIRAGAPEGWSVAEKSGGAGAIRNDVAVLDSPEGEQVVLVVLTERNDTDAEYEDALVAEVAEAVLPTG